MDATVILTRARAQSLRFAAAVRARFGADTRILIAPVLEIAPLPPLPALEPRDALILTSENGAGAYRALGGAAGRLAYCVGQRTAEAATAAGLVAKAGPGDADGLAAWLAEAPPDGRLVHLHGVHVTGDLAARLRGEGLRVTAAVIYDQRAVPLSVPARAALAGTGPVLIPVFSARTARLLVPELRQARAALRLAAISPAVAAGLPVQAGAEVEIALHPDGEGMLDAMARLGAGESS